MNTVKIELTDEQIKQLKPLTDEAQRISRNDETVAIIGQVMLYGGFTYLDLVELWANVFSGDEFGVIKEMIVDGKSKVKELTENIEILAETLNSNNVTMLRQEAEIAQLNNDNVRLWSDNEQLREALAKAGIVYEDGAQEE